MRKLMGAFMFAWVAGVLLWVSVPANSAPPKAAERWYSLTNAHEAGGLWVQRDGAKPIGSLYASRIGGQDHAVLGFYRDGSKAEAHDFAIVTDADGVRFQIRDDAGKLHWLPASALLKLTDGNPKVIRGPPEAVEGVGKGELRKRLLLDVMRHHAVNRLVRDGLKTPDGKVRKVDRDEARELVAKVKDETILAMAVEKGAPVGEGGKLEALLDWILAHKEEIIRFIMLLISLFADDR